MRCKTRILFASLPETVEAKVTRINHIYTTKHDCSHSLQYLSAILDGKLFSRCHGWDKSGVKAEVALRATFTLTLTCVTAVRLV